MVRCRTNFKYVEKVKALIDQPLDKLELGHVRLAMVKVKCPHKLDISVFYQLTRRLPHEDIYLSGLAALMSAEIA